MKIKPHLLMESVSSRAYVPLDALANYVKIVHLPLAMYF